MRVCFPLLAQVHQAYHSLPIALELARRHPDIEVEVACGAHAGLERVRALAGHYDATAPVRFRALRSPPGIRWLSRHRDSLPKYLVMLANVGTFASFDALVVPELTTLHLKALLPRTRLVWTRHGAGDRAVGFKSEIARFDFVMMAGAKLERRMLEAGVITPGRYVTGIYAKFDLVRRLPRQPLFANDRPTVLYNPHFRAGLSSWPSMGERVLDLFAANDRYNLVFAPHMRLFYPPTERHYAQFARYSALPHMRIDLGSDASADMTYTDGADIYLGDVSSQVAEFVIRPRPCLFLNAHRVSWQDDPNYAAWQLGEVIEDVAMLPKAFAQATSGQDNYVSRQRAYVRETFGDLDHPTAPRAADALAQYLRDTRGRA